MKKFKFILTLFLSAIMLLNGSMISFASTTAAVSAKEISAKHDILELQSVMNTYPVILSLENQTKTFSVPLSSGKTATVTIQLKKVGPTPRIDKYTAKLGDWNIDYNASIPSSGSIKLRANFTVTHVPDMSIPDLDWAHFHVTGSSISAVPPQGSSLTDKNSSYETKMTDAEYLVEGYATFNLHGQAVNYYVSMSMYSPGNSGDDRDKIYVITNLHI